MRGAIPPLPKYVFMAWYLAKHRDNFTFYLYSDSAQEKKWNYYQSRYAADTDVLLQRYSRHLTT
jgi:hypothetical protein